MKQWTGQFVGKPGSVCPGFHRLRYLAACPHGCAYCYLQGAYWRGRPDDITEADLPEMERAVARWMERTGEPTILNVGELSDSFAPDICAQASLRLVELFRRQDRHTLLLVTKADTRRWLASIEPTPQVVLSYSLGQVAVPYGAWHEELGHRWQELLDIAPAWPDEALLLAVASGWRVRVRVDPMITEGDWGHWIAERLGEAKIERITLGTLRFTRPGYRAVAHGSPFQAALAARVALEEGEAGTHPYRLPLAQRVGLYAAALRQLEGQADDIGLCKETPEAWRQVFGETPRTIACNCTM